MEQHGTQVARGARTVDEVLRRLVSQGWAGDMLVRPQGQVECVTCGQLQPAAELQVVHQERLEGASDPADMAIVVAVRCAHCATQCALALTYGPEASPDDSDVVAALPETVTTT